MSHNDEEDIAEIQRSVEGFWQEMSQIHSAGADARRISENRLEANILANMCTAIAQIISLEELVKSSSYPSKMLQDYMHSFRKDDNKEVKREESMMVKALYNATNMYKIQTDKVEKLEKEVVRLKKKIHELESRTGEDVKNTKDSKESCDAYKHKDKKRQRI